MRHAKLDRALWPVKLRTLASVADARFCGAPERSEEASWRFVFSGAFHLGGDDFIGKYARKRN